MSSTSEQLSAQSGQLQQVVSFFKLDDAGRPKAYQQTVTPVREQPKPLAQAAPKAAQSDGVALDMESDDEFEKS